MPRSDLLKYSRSCMGQAGAHGQGGGGNSGGGVTGGGAGRRAPDGPRRVSAPETSSRRRRAGGPAEARTPRGRPPAYTRARRRRITARHARRCCQGCIGASPDIYHWAFLSHFGQVLSSADWRNEGEVVPFTKI